MWVILEAGAYALAGWVIGVYVPTAQLNENDLYMTLGLFALGMLVLFRVVRPVLKLFLLPVRIITLGLIMIVVDIAFLWLILFLVPGINIISTMWLLVAGLGMHVFTRIIRIARD